MRKPSPEVEIVFRDGVRMYVDARMFKRIMRIAEAYTAANIAGSEPATVAMRAEINGILARMP
jgi:hypothetical protein